MIIIICYNYNLGISSKRQPEYLGDLYKHSQSNKL